MASLARVERIPPIPLETAQAARAALRSDDRVALFMELGDALGEIFAGVRVVSLACIADGAAPHILAIATILQCVEGLSDLGAVESMRARAGWRYALRVGAEDPLPDAAALRAFRVHLLEDRNAAREFDVLLARLAASEAGREVAPLPSGTAALVDAVQTLNLLGLMLRAMRMAGSALLESRSPDARGVFPAEWRERYLEAPHWPSLPRDVAARSGFALEVAADGFVLIDAAERAFAGSEGGPLREVVALRRTWEWLFERDGPYVAWRGRPRLPGRDPQQRVPVARGPNGRVAAPLVAVGGRRSGEAIRSGP